MRLGLAGERTSRCFRFLYILIFLLAICSFGGRRAGGLAVNFIRRWAGSSRLASILCCRICLACFGSLQRIVHSDASQASSLVPVNSSLCRLSAIGSLLLWASQLKSKRFFSNCVRGSERQF